MDMNLSEFQEIVEEGEDCTCCSEVKIALVVFDCLQPHELYSPWNSLGQNTGVDSRSLLQVIFSTQGSNPGLPHCRQILYQLNYQMCYLPCSNVCMCIKLSPCTL